VVVPCYNEASHLQSSVATLLGVLESTRYTYDVIFVDDMSQDETREVLRSICARHSQCRYVFHEANKGRGGAFKTGFASSLGRATGFIDIDLEVHALYIPALVSLILDQGYDVATGHRHYLLSQTGAIHRHLMSLAYRGLTRILLGLGVKDSETGFKFFNRATASEVVLRCENDGWFFDTEVMSRAALANLKIYEMPVLFRRRPDKKSTVRLLEDSLSYLSGLYRIRSRLGLSLHDRSPIYWSARGYDAIMRLLYGRQLGETLAEVARLIPEGSSVVDLCAGTSRLYFDHLKSKGCDYQGLDCNGHFVMAARNRGAKARLFDVAGEEIPPADYVVMCNSFYHFHTAASEVVQKMLRAARSGVIISEPVKNLSSHPLRIFAGVANRLTDPGIGDYHYRYDPESFEGFARAHGATEFHYRPGGRNAVAVFNKANEARA
jgi:glycosyltransferase involved in cell wall biosynthesis